MTHPIAVLVSGSGRHLENFARLATEGSLDVEISLALCDRSGVGAIDRARAANLPLTILDGQRKLDNEAFGVAAWDAIRASGARTVILAGFLRLLPIAEDYRGRILNIHPSLLPAFGGKGFYGDRVHEAVLARGCKVTGCSVHLVEEEFDTGPILLQRWCAVEPGDTPPDLAQRVFELELEAYPTALRDFLSQPD